MPTDKDLIKDTLAVGGHYSNYSPGFIVGGPPYWIGAAQYLYIGSWFDESAVQFHVLRLSFPAQWLPFADTLVPLHSSVDFVSQLKYVVQ